MRRVTKQEGQGNIVLEETEIPVPSTTQVLIQMKASLISRGSELWRRYMRQEAVDPAIMGYSAAGVVQAVGSEVDEFQVGDRVAALAPHAEYVVVDAKQARHSPSVVKLPEEISFEAGTFWPLCTSCVCWSWSAAIQPGDTVVILGQGLVGSLMLQTIQPWGAAKTIAVDALPLRCQFAQRLGADQVINVAENDPVEVVRAQTARQGADVVIEAVGGPAGIRAFQQGLKLARTGGRIMLIGLYQDTALPLDAAEAMTKQIVGANQYIHRREHASRIALKMLATGFVRAGDMITHRFDSGEAKAAFDLLYEHPGEALGVVLLWQ